MTGPYNKKSQGSLRRLFFLKILLVIISDKKYLKQEISLKKIIVEGYRAVGSLNDSFQSSNFLLAPFVVVVLY